MNWYKFITIVAWMLGPMMTLSIIMYIFNNSDLSRLSKPFILIAVILDAWLIMRYFG